MPLTVEIPSAEQAVDGVVVNLSAAGLACVLQLALAEGEQVRCRFRPALGEERLEILAEVVWQHAAGGEDSLYGMRFIDLSNDNRERIAAVVHERTFGTAGEWPLPVMPAAAPTAGRRVSPYLTAAFGLVAGIGLSLVLSLVPSFVADCRAQPVPEPRAITRGATAEAAKPAGSPVVDAPLDYAGIDATERGDSAPMLTIGDEKHASASPAVPVAPKSAVSPAVAAAAPVAPKPAAGPAVAAAAPAPASATVPASKSMAATPSATSTGTVATTDPPSTTSAGATTAPTPAVSASSAHKLSTAVTSKGLDISLRVDRPAATYKTFWLDHPRRLVVDVPGVRNGLDGTDFAIVGPLASRLRVGTHEDKVRFVVYTAEKIGSAAQVHFHGITVLVSLSKH